MSLKECIRLAQDKSSPGIAVKNRYKSRKNNFNSFKTNLLPQLSLDLNVPSLFRSIDEVVQPDGSRLFTPQYRISSNASFNLSQEIVPTNTQLIVSSGLTRLDIIDPVESLLWRSTPFQIQIQQQIFSFNRLKWENRIQDKQIKFFDKRYIEEMENIAIEVTSKFFNLFSQQINFKNAEKNLALNDTLFKISKGRYSIGKIAENDLLQS
ncbi:TolC family protein, partial [Candidatus Kapabacteria bacterium]|nr:TolC family protein [Candidatus Kapabacteria bacterium]